jgi:hypothetical protein
MEKIFEWRQAETLRQRKFEGGSRKILLPIGRFARYILTALFAMKSHFGDQYPAAVTINGVWMPLVTERRWTRYYASKNPNMGFQVSRFMDGSATITFQEFAREWPDWSERERQDFCSACSWLHEQPDYPDILRYIMQHGGPKDWSAIASPVGASLPQDEAFDLLTRALRSTDLGIACNIVQGIAVTKHRDAERVLRAHLSALWSQPALSDDDDFNNWFAYGATCCIKHLIEIGAPREDFAEHVQELAKHACANNRDSCRRFLAKYFPWLNEQPNAPGNA